jgi:hypothetical protein
VKKAPPVSWPLGKRRVKGAKRRAARPPMTHSIRRKIKVRGNRMYQSQRQTPGSWSAACSE